MTEKEWNEISKRKALIIANSSAWKLALEREKARRTENSASSNDSQLEEWQAYFYSHLKEFVENQYAEPEPPNEPF